MISKKSAGTFLWLVMTFMLVIGMVATAAPAYAGYGDGFGPQPEPQVTNGQGQETCEDGPGWTKVEDLESLSYTFTAPEGKLIAEWCTKDANNVVYGDVEPPQKSVTVYSSSNHDLSHASFRLVDAPVEIKDLNLTFMQPCEPAEGTPDLAEWRIRNPNDFAVEVYVTKAGDGTVYGPISVGPGDTFFTTPWGSQTLILHWDGGTRTKAGGDSYNGTLCEDPVEKSYKAHQAVTCEGVHRVVNLYEDGKLVDTLYNEWVYFTDPYALEKVPAITVDVPEEYGKDYTFAAVDEPEACQKEHQTDVWYEASCEQYWGGYMLDGQKVETFRADWQDPYGPEAVTVEVFVPIPEGEEGQDYFSVRIEKSRSCIECRITPAYPMASYIVNDAPDTYWQGPFGLGPGVCNVIHQEGETPSAERVATICSLCEDQIEGGFVYDVRNGNGRQFYDGWVYKVDCYGREPYYTYMGYNWDAYQRDASFTNTGERLCNRVDGCADWIHDNYEADPE